MAATVEVMGEGGPGTTLPAPRHQRRLTRDVLTMHSGAAGVVLVGVLGPDS